jgi:hypothetical protein
MTTGLTKMIHEEKIPDWQPPDRPNIRKDYQAAGFRARQATINE